MTTPGTFRTAAIATAVATTAKPEKLPSIFDIWAQQSLHSTIKPALGYLLKAIRAWRPDAAKWPTKYFDELYLVLSSLFEAFYLQKYTASFSENFYAMKRISRVGGRIPSRSSRWRSLVLLTLVPYLKGKLDDFQETLKGVAEQQRTKFAVIYLKYYPLLKAVLSAIGIALQVAYVFGFVGAPSLGLFLSGTRLEKLTTDDLARFESLPLHLQSGGLLARLWRLVISLPSVLARVLTYGLFFVQFLEFFYSSDAADEFGFGHKRASAPTHPATKPSEIDILTLEVDKCPLCYEKRVNDAVLSVSGYVFCFSCINDFVRREGLCPVTHLPATPLEIIRLYST